MECQICGEELHQNIQIIRLIKAFDDHVKIGVCGKCLEAIEEYLRVMAAVCNKRRDLETDLAEQRKELKKK